MMQTVYIILNVFLNALECVIAFYLANSFFERRHRKWNSTFAILVPFIIADVVLLNLFAQWYMVKMVSVVLLIAFWIYFFYQASLSQSAVVSVLFISYLTIIDSIWLSIAASIPALDLSSLYSDPNAYYLFCYGAKALELFGVVLFCTILRDRLHMPYASWSDWLRTLCFPFATLLVSTYLAYIFTLAPSLAPQLLVCNVILLFSDIMSIFLLEYMEKQQRAVRDNAILQQNLKAERESLEVWSAAYREQRKQSHDFQNQLAVLRGMLVNDAPRDTFLQYVDSLSTQALPASLCVDTHRPIADALLGQKAAVASGKGLDLRLQLSSLQDFPLPDDALVVVLSNLIDNAIEAVEQVTEQERRYILLKMQVLPESSYLYIENPTDHPVTIRKNRVATTKASPFFHGFGLQNVEAILTQYDATFALEYQPAERLFCFSAEIAPER